ncbi:2-dehydropantoate 2-reductase [Kiritimatiellota bacterium B12222]|nr:2-dehydropantoate 2-reductase [Kiritimatiellota bacterium B12222]
MKLTIGIFGLGGVGGFYGGKLCQIQDEQTQIAFFARGEHLNAIQQNGLTLKTEKDGKLLCRPSVATDSLDEMPELDLCILCVKGFDLHPLLLQLKDRISDHTVILPLLNGADVYDRIRAVIPNGIVLPACVYIGTHIERPGVVAQKGAVCNIIFGTDPQRPDYPPEALMEILQRADIQHQYREDIQSCIWEKFTFVASFAIVTTAYNKTIGDVSTDPYLRAEAADVISEILAIAAKVGVKLPHNIAEAVLSKADIFPTETKTSLQRDFDIKTKPDERELLAGTILRYAKEFDINLPKTEALYNQLEALKPSVIQTQ